MKKNENFENFLKFLDEEIGGKGPEVGERS